MTSSKEVSHFTEKLHWNPPPIFFTDSLQFSTSIPDTPIWIYQETIQRYIERQIVDMLVGSSLLSHFESLAEGGEK